MALLTLAKMTLANGLRQPLTWLMTGLSVALIGLSYLFGMFNFVDEDRLRMLATAGVAVGVINGLFLAVVGASTTIHDELASRTALTLFAKPIDRSSFLLGKTLGVWLTVLASTALVIAAHAVVLGLVATNGFEGRHDEHEGHHHHGGDEPLVVPWRAIALAHALGLGHSAVLACIAAVLALRIPLIANVLISFAVFVLGHVLAGFKFMGAVAIPALALFNIDDAIQLPGQSLAWTYCTATLAYAVVFCAGCLSLGLALFQRQDIP